MSTKQYTDEQITASALRLDEALAEHKQHKDAQVAITELSEKIRALHAAGVSKSQIRVTLKDAGLIVPARLIAEVLTPGVQGKRQYRPRKQASSDPISLQADTSNQHEDEEHL